MEYLLSGICPSCGARIATGDRFCVECGHALSGAPEQVTVATGPSTQPQPVSSQKRNGVILGLIAAGLLVLGIGAFQVMQQNTEAPERLAAKAPSVPMRPAPAAVPERSEVVRAPPPQPELGCGNLIAPGEKMVCAASEPNWDIEFSCTQTKLTSIFTDVFSSPDLLKTPGTATLSSQNPWVIRTSQGLAGTIGATPGSCRSDFDGTFDFTFTPSVVPGLKHPETICCWIVR